LSTSVGFAETGLLPAADACCFAGDGVTVAVGPLEFEAAELGSRLDISGAKRGAKRGHSF